MWNPFKKKKHLDQRPKWHVVKQPLEFVRYKYNITIKMQNGEIFKTEMYDEIIKDIQFKSVFNPKKLERFELLKHNLQEPNLSPYTDWTFPYQGTTLSLNITQISWIQHTKIPFETVQVEDEVLELVEEDLNE